MTADERRAIAGIRTTENNVAKTIFLTGAAGRIGAALRPGLLARYGRVKLADQKPLEGLASGEEAVQLDVADLGAVEAAMAGSDAIVHLAAAVSPAGWDVMFEPNFIGTYNVFEAARRVGVRRVVYASSIHAHGFHRRANKIGSDTPPRPDSIYGVSKVFGEAMGRLYADKHGLEVVCLRIASFQPKPSTPRHLATWLSPRDCLQLVCRSIEATGVHFEALYGVSRNTRQIYYNPEWQRIGYHPEDDAEAYAEEILTKQPIESEPELERAFHGAMYVSKEFTGRADRIT